MGQSSLNRLPEALRFRGDLVGLISGCVALLLALIDPLFGSAFSGATGIVFKIIFVSTLAGIFGCLFRHDKSGDAHSALAPRVGVRASIIASFVGAALVVIVATLQSFGVGSPTPTKLSVFSLIVPRSYAFQILVIAVMGIPPAIFFGTAASILTALRGKSFFGPGSTADGVPPTKQSGLNTAIRLLCIVGLLSPFVVLLKPKAKPKPVAVAPATPAPIVPVQQKWRYEKPAGFDTAEASRIVISDIRAFSEVEGGFPVALSPDERMFACFTRTPSLALEIRDLANLDVISRAEFTDEPVSLVWAPDTMSLILSRCEDERKR